MIQEWIPQHLIFPQDFFRRGMQAEKKKKVSSLQAFSESIADQPVFVTFLQNVT